jgi:hypothetical protein
MTNIDKKAEEAEKIRFLTRNITHRHSAEKVYHLNAGEKGIVREHSSPSHYNVIFEGVPMPVKVRKMSMSRTNEFSVVVPYDEEYVRNIHSD